MAGWNVNQAASAKMALDAIDESETIEFLRSLVRVPSVNPPGDVRDAIEICRRILEAEGFSVQIAQSDPIKPNLLAEYGSARSPVLCYNAHVDVVPTGEVSAWTYPPFGAELINGRVYGRGAGDDKASVTAQVMAGVALARAGVKLRGRLVITAVADEEVGGPAGTDLLLSGGHVRPDFVIVGEQTRNQICVGEKGAAGTLITVHGRAAHGALPWEGANAIEAMGLIVVAIQRELWPLLESRTHPFFHHSSGSINTIEGGVKENVVADYCRVTVDRRLVPGEDPADAVAEINTIAQGAVAGMSGISVEVTALREGRAAIVSDASSPLVQGMLTANRYLGLSDELTGFSMATDGRFFAEAGYPTIIYGPGDPSLAHVPDEWVGVDEVLAATRAYALAAISLFGVES